MKTEGFNYRYNTDRVHLNGNNITYAKTLLYRYSDITV